MAVFYIHSIDSPNRESGYSLMLDINSGYGWRYTSFGSWAVMLEWLKRELRDDVRIFISARHGRVG